MKTRALWGLLLAGLVAGAGLAADRPALDAAEAAAYRGVGRLNVYHSRFCTATLIGDTLVLTAAHCLFSPLTGHQVRLHGLEFVAGQYGDDQAAVRQVVRMAVMPGFVYDPQAVVGTVGSDIALLQLDTPVPAAAARPFPVRSLNGGAPLTIVSYGKDRPLTPTSEGPCPVRAGGAVLTLACAIPSGASGAPVLDGTGVVAVVSAMGSGFGGGFALAVPAADKLAALRTVLAGQKLRKVKPRS